MDISHVFCPQTREAWRSWLEDNRPTAAEIWLQAHYVKSGNLRVPYDDAVEEALCFGWIDGITKKFNDNSSLQRYTPRRPKSNLSEINRQRIFKLIRQGKMTEAGLAPIRHLLGSEDDPLEISEDLASIFQKNPLAWENFNQFPIGYGCLYRKFCRAKSFKSVKLSSLFRQICQIYSPKRTRLLWLQIC